MKLEKPDKKRCQAEVLGGNFMTFGPRMLIRCENKPIAIITENKKPHGSMSVCDDCLKYARKKLGRTFTTKKLKAINTQDK